MGSCNLHKQKISGDDLVKYLAYQSKHFKLTPSSEIKGMEVFQHNARGYDQRFSAPGEDYTQPNATRDETLNDTEQFNLDPANETDPLEVWKHIYPPHLLYPPKDNFIEMHGEQIDLNSLSPEERKQTILEWQSTNIWNFEQEQSPMGYIFAFQEGQWLPKYHRMGPWARGHMQSKTIHYDQLVENPRAGILTSPNMDCWLEPHYTDRDTCTVSWNSGTEHGNIYVISYYGANNNKGRDENVVISDTLKRVLNRCRRENKPFILLGDLNSWSFEWGMPMRNPNNINWWRGEVWEDAMLDYDMTCLNVGDEWTWYKSDSVREENGEEPINSIVDVCFCSTSLSTLVSNWMVRDAAPSSDHTSLEFCFHIEHPEAFENYKTVFNYMKGDYPNYTQTIEENCPDIFDNDVLEHGNFEDLNKEVDSFVNTIIEGASKHIPTKVLDRRTVPDHTRGWWNSDCRKWRNKLTKIRSYLRKTKREPLKPGEMPKWTVKDRQEAIKNYNKAQRKARKKHWDKVLENKKSNRDLGKLLTSLKTKTHAEVNCFINPDGTSMSPKDTLNTLCHEHFPDCLEAPDRETCQAKLERDNKINNSHFNIKDRKADIITLEKLKKAIADNDSIKGTGTDGIPPVLFKKLGPKALDRLLRIFKASYLMGLHPEKWLEIKAIFIPKPGKGNYSTPRSFRPISLMQFMMKIMERVMLFIIREQTGFQLHENQHGFVDGKSCDSNLTAWVNTIEKGFVDWAFTLGVYIDIKGAFDNATNEGIRRMMEKKGCSQDIINWFMDFLENRNITIKYKGYDITVWPTKGTPQGGVASPWLWNIIADEIHERLEQETGINSLGYADDTVIYICHSDPQEAVNLMTNIALPIALRWAEEFGLEIAPEKTVAVLYTRRLGRKEGNARNKDGSLRGSYDLPSPVRFMGREIEWSNEQKHLGVIIEEKLNWNGHINNKLKKAKGLLINLKNSQGKIHGLKPYAALTLYKWCRSMIVHGCLVWHQAVYKQSTIDKLRNFQSTGLRTMGLFRHSTPTCGLEILTHTYPLHLYIMVLAALSYFRTRGFEKFPDHEMEGISDNKDGHRVNIRTWIQTTLNDMGAHNTVFDDINRTFLWNKKFTVDTFSYSSFNERKGTPIVDSDLSMYTDGSYHDENPNDIKAGAGLVIYECLAQLGRRKEQKLLEFDWHLGQSTIFQCEMYAIKKAAQWICENHRKPELRPFNSVVIYSDSLSSVQILQNYVTKSQIVKDTFEWLNRAGRLVHITIRWVKAHAEHAGNVRADDLANDGARDTESDPVEDLPKMPFSQMKTKLHRKALEIWSKEWNENMFTKHSHRQTKNWFPEPNGRKARDLVQKNDRIPFSRKVSLYTGHGPFAYHENRISNGAVSKYCDLCNLDGMVQDAEHIITECQKFRDTREIIFGPIVPPLDTLTDKQISEFIEETMKQDFPWFPPEEGEPIEEDQRSYNSESPNNSISEEEPSPGPDIQNNNPGFDLFDPDSDDEPSSGPETSDYDEDQYLLSPNAVPDLSPYQSYSEQDSDTNQFLLNENDMYSDLDSESDTDSNSQNDSVNSNINDFHIEDIYIDDEIDEIEPLPEHDLDPIPDQDNNNSNFVHDRDSDLDHYLVGPDGVYLEQSTDTDSDMSFYGNDLVPDLDPEPSPGPVDPG